MTTQIMLAYSGPSIYGDAYGGGYGDAWGAGIFRGGKRVVQGSGGYVYQQDASGDIWILKGAKPPGHENGWVPANPNNPIWLAITREIGATGKWKGDPRIVAATGRKPAVPSTFSADAPVEVAPRGQGFASAISQIFGLTQQGAQTYVSVRRAVKGGGRRRAAPAPAPAALPAPARPPIPVWALVAGGVVLLGVIILIVSASRGDE